MEALRQIIVVAAKELRIIARDRGALAILFLLPLLFGMMYGSLNMQVAQDDAAPTELVRAALVLEDDGAYGEQVAEALRGVKVVAWERADTLAQAEARVNSGELAAAVLLPEGMSAGLLAQQPMTLEVVADLAQPEAAAIVVSVVERVAAEAALWGELQHATGAALGAAGRLEEEAEPLGLVEAQAGAIMGRLAVLRDQSTITLKVEDQAGETVRGGIELFIAHLFPAFTVMFVFFTVGVSGAALLSERESGTLGRLLSAPVSRTVVITGKALGYVALACAQVVVLFAVARAAFGMPLGDSPAGLVALTLLVAMVATAMGMMIASLAHTAKQADTWGTLQGFVLGGLGGCIAIGATPLTRSGGVMASVARLTPQGNALEAYYSLMAENAGLVGILPEMGVLAAMGLAFGAVAAWRLR
jgi:ABC-2 type transport system permease protein